MLLKGATIEALSIEKDGADRYRDLVTILDAVLVHH